MCSTTTCTFRVLLDERSQNCSKHTGWLLEQVSVYSFDSQATILEASDSAFFTVFSRFQEHYVVLQICPILKVET